MRFNAINETAIQWLCGGKAEWSGCHQIRSQLRATNRATARKTARPKKCDIDPVAPDCRSLEARRAGQDRAAPKGSLDAPKRFRIIDHQSDAKPDRSVRRWPLKCGMCQLDRTRT